MTNTIVNLDKLKAESKKVIFLEKEFELGYIPSGLAIPLIEDYNKNLKEQKETDIPEKIMKDEIKSVSIFCSFYESEFTEEYLAKNATDKQIDAFYKMLIFSIYNNFASVSSEEKGSFEEDNSLQKKTTSES